MVRLRTAAVNAVRGLAKPCGHRLGGSPGIVALSYVGVAVVVVLMTDPRTLTRMANDMAPTSKS